MRSKDVFPFFSPGSEGPWDINCDGCDTTHELLKRQTNNGCALGQSSCANIGGVGLCCRPSTSCALDQLGVVACCPIGAVCTGAISPTAGIPVTTPTVTGFVLATTPILPPLATATTQGFIVAASTPGVQANGALPTRSTVLNQYYPFAYIPTTYVNAAACTSAYSSCQSDFSSCTAALGRDFNGVTVEGPNGGVTVPAFTMSLPSSSASQVCQSLSAQACYGLQVEACQAFGTAGAVVTPPADSAAAHQNCCHWNLVYCFGAGVAVGMAGQMFA